MACSLGNSAACALFALAVLAGLQASAQSPSPLVIAAQVKTATQVALVAKKPFTYPIGVHWLTINPAKITTTISGMVITGQITRQRSLLPDQHLIYTIKKVNDKVVSVDYQAIGFSTPRYIPVFSKNFVSKYIAPTLIDPLIQFLAKQVGDKWETTAELLVVSIAAHAKDPSGAHVPVVKNLNEQQGVKLAQTEAK